MHIDVRTLTGKTHRLEVDPQESIPSVRQKLCDQESGLSTSQIKLIYGGKLLQDYGGTTLKTLAIYNIRDAATLHMTLGLRAVTTGSLENISPDASARRAQKEWKSKSELYDFDEDLHIVDPPSHFQLLNQLERDVVHRSIYFKEKRTFDISGVSNTNLFDSYESEEIDHGGLERHTWLKNIWTAVQESSTSETSFQNFQHFLKSCSIISHTSESLAQMQAARFSTQGISFLRQHEIANVIEIRRVEVAKIDVLKGCMYTIASEISTNLNEEYLAIKVREIMSLGHDLLTHMGFEKVAKKLNLQAALTRVRKLVLLLDVVVVSYVRSHSSGFDMSFFGSELGLQRIPVGIDEFGFTLSWLRLACLDAFLDRRKVLVFNFFDEDDHRPTQGIDRDSQVLTSMQDLADIWGPVYTVPSTNSLIKHYGVSKGVICRVKGSSGCVLPGAVNCHYFSRASFFVQQTSRLLSRDEDLLLTENDGLLIGGGLRENQNCDYSIEDFKQDWALDTSILGTHESVWRMESRSLSIGVSKYLGITVSGSQKLVPRTTLKQHILDKWSTNAARSNPGILNRYLGVEVSHCTGNARRIPLRTLMTISSITLFLERQSPGWTETPWGHALSAALHTNDQEAIFRTWKEFASDRPHIGELFCCFLELLDCTGEHDGEADAAFLYNDDESAIRISRRGEDTNDWSRSIEDSHLTCAYVINNEQCLNCEVPNHTASVCHTQHTYTVLETDFAIGPSADPNDSTQYKIRPNDRRLRLVDCGSTDIAMLSYVARFGSMFKRESLTKPQELVEICSPNKYAIRGVVFVRSSKRSFHGKKTPKQSAIAHQSNLRAAQDVYNSKRDGQQPDRASHSTDTPHDAPAVERSSHLQNQLDGTQGDKTLTTQNSSTPGLITVSSKDRKKQELEENTEEEVFRAPDPRRRTDQLQTADANIIDYEDLIHSDVYGQNMCAHLPDNNRRLSGLRDMRSGAGN